VAGEISVCQAPVRHERLEGLPRCCYRGPTYSFGIRAFPTPDWTPAPTPKTHALYRVDSINRQHPTAPIDSTHREPVRQLIREHPLRGSEGNVRTEAQWGPAAWGRLGYIAGMKIVRPVHLEARTGTEACSPAIPRTGRTSPVVPRAGRTESAYSQSSDSRDSRKLL